MPPRKPIKPEETVPLQLSPREKALLLADPMLRPNVESKLHSAVIEGEELVVQLTLSEAEELADVVAAAANHARSKKLERELDAVYRRLEQLLESYTDEEEEPAGGLPPLGPALAEVLSYRVEDLDLGIGDELEAAADAAVLLRQELGGLSLVEAAYLCATPWEAPEGFVHLNEELSLEELQGADILANARVLLRAILDAGGVKATVAGNLNRRFVDDMLEGLRAGEREVQILRTSSKVLNERDFWPLHIVRIVTGLARLLRRTKGVFQVTKKGQALLADDKAGELYALLFRTYFCQFNLFYGTYLPPLDWLQATVGFSFFMVGQHAREWMNSEDLAPLLVSPMAKFELEEKWPSAPATGWPVGWRLISPLESFGLLEKRSLPGEQRWLRSHEVRVTRLFDRFLRFDRPGPQRSVLLPGTH